MNNKTDLFTEIGILLKEEADLDWEDIGHYLEIINQYPNYIDCIIKELIECDINYIPAVDDGWNATKGSVTIDKYRIELCCYGGYAINLYHNEELLEMLMFQELSDINRQITTIDTEIQALMQKREKLTNMLKQTA